MGPLLPETGALRADMVERQLMRRGIRDNTVLDAMRRVPRELFVPPQQARYAYDDRALPIEAGQTISQPYVVALTLEAARLSPDAKVLEVGTGSGYVAALLSGIVTRVFTIEYHAILAEQAAARLADLGCPNVEIRTGDGSLGWPGAAPFDAILVAACARKIPRAWKEQLAPGGRIVAPVGKRRQRLVCLKRTGADTFTEEYLADVRFVPLLGEG